MRNTCPSSNGGNLGVGGKRLSCTRAFLLSLPDRLFIHSMFGLRYRVAPHSSVASAPNKPSLFIPFHSSSRFCHAFNALRFPLLLFANFFPKSFFSMPILVPLAEREKFHRVIFKFLPLSLARTCLEVLFINSYKWSILLLLIYIHIRRNIFYCSYKLHRVWGIRIISEKGERNRKLTWIEINQRISFILRILSYVGNEIIRILLHHSRYQKLHTIPYRTLERNLPFEI